MRHAFGGDAGSAKVMEGKESLSIDMKSPEGRDLVHELIARGDVFVTRLPIGCGREARARVRRATSKINPRLVYVHAAGYGTDGPYAHRALYAQAAQAVAGSFGRQVGYWADPAQNEGMSVIELQAIVAPRLNQVVDGDSNAALGVLAALSLAIYHQRRTGQGQFVRTSMISGNAWCYSDDVCTYDGKPPVAICDSEYYGTSALDRVDETADGWVCLAIRTQHEYERLVTVLGVSELGTDGRFNTAETRAANDDALAATLAARFKEKAAAEWESVLLAADVGCVEAFMKGMPAFTSFDPVLRETGLTVEIEHPIFGPMVRAASPVAFSDTPGRVASPCVRGEHNAAILSELGYSPEGVATLEADGVVFPPS